jgi:predicted dehydrogenase
MKQLRWGVLSTADIGRKVIPALQTSVHNVVVAVASRDIKKAQTFAAELNIPCAYGSYEALLNDTTIDAIYNPLPNHLHVPWSIKALAAGKHVLCEKPLGLNASDVENLVHSAKQFPHLNVMEAFMYRFHPQWLRARELVNTGSIGQVRSIHSHFAYNNRDADNIRNEPAMGGGALMDIGCYCISLARFIYNEEPLRVIGQITPYAGYDVDCFFSGMLEFADGNASFTAATKMAPEQYVKIHGEQGNIFIPLPFNPIADTATHLVLQRNQLQENIFIHASNHYRTMGDAFAQSVLQQAPVPTPLGDALANMKIIDALFTSAQNNQWVNLA